MFNEIWKFSLSEDYYDIRHAPFDKNIFNLLSEKNLKVLYKTFTSLSGEFLLGDDEKINYVKQFYSEFDFVFLYYYLTREPYRSHGATRILKMLWAPSRFLEEFNGFPRNA